jgi:hypothetical protein
VLAGEYLVTVNYDTALGKPTKTYPVSL